MRTVFLLSVAALLMGCSSPNVASNSPSTEKMGATSDHTSVRLGMQTKSVPSVSAEQAKLERWRRKRAKSNRDLVQARRAAEITGDPITSQIDGEAIELLNHDIDAPTEDIRIERLQEAVSDALRLAELVSIG